MELAKVVQSDEMNVLSENRVSAMQEVPLPRSVRPTFALGMERELNVGACHAGGVSGNHQVQ